MCRQNHESHSDTMFHHTPDDHKKSIKQQNNIETTTSYDSTSSEPPSANTMQKSLKMSKSNSSEMIESHFPKEEYQKRHARRRASDDSSSDETDLSSVAKTSPQKGSDDDKKVEQPSNRIPLSDVGPYDVLSGRDKAVFNHVGNRRFRVSLALWIPRYDEAQSKSQKASVIGSLCHMLQHEAGVRFLKRQQGDRGEEDYYVELNATQTKKKVGHAIRDMSVARKEVSQRRHSARKAQRQAKKKKIISSGGDSSSSDDDASTTSELTENNLRDSLAALLPFVSSDPQADEEASMEPLPFSRMAMDANGSTSFASGATVSMEATVRAASESIPNFSASSPSVLVPPPTLPTAAAHLLRSNSFPGPSHYFHANHYHYHYHQYPYNQEAGMAPASLSGQHFQPLLNSQRPRHGLYDNSIRNDVGDPTKPPYFGGSDAFRQQERQQDPSH
jgi:hypothetical protein